jgi:hypothetical protein
MKLQRNTPQQAAGYLGMMNRKSLAGLEHKGLHPKQNLRLVLKVVAAELPYA